MRLSCVSLGPRDRGRDHGLLPRFQAIRLAREAKATLGDFALALFEWGLEPRPPFAAFFPLDGVRHLHLLVRAAFLGRDLLGPNVIANGLILDDAALEAVDWRPHVLMPHIQPPEAGEWTELAVDVAVAAERARTADPMLIKLGRGLRTQRIMLELADDRSPEAVVPPLIETARPTARQLHYWATSADLIPIERFDPAIFRLLVHAVDPASPRAPGAHRIDSAGLGGPELIDHPVLRFHEALFSEDTMPDGWAGRFPAAAAACGRVADPRDRLGDDPVQVVLDGMLATIAEPGIDLEQFRGLVERWAEAGAAMEREDESVVDLAIGVAFRRLFEAQSGDEAKLRLLRDYIALSPRLRAGAPKLPASLASKHNLFRWLDETELEWLVERGLGDDYASETEKAVRTGGVASDRLAAVSRALRGVLDRQGNPAAGSLRLGTVVVNRVADVGEADERLFRSAGDEAFALGEQMLLRSVQHAEWGAVVPDLVRIWTLAEAHRTNSPVAARLLAAPRRLFRERSGRDDERRTKVAFAMLRGGGGMA